MGRRERCEAALFHALAAAACLGWWLWLARAPEVRARFLGERAAAQQPFLLLVPDLLALVCGGAWLAFGIARRRREASALAWIHFGAAGYAWTLSAVSAVDDPGAYSGFVAMSALVAPAFVVALRLAGVSFLWGPFRFRPARGIAPDALRRASLRQTAVMWLLFFGVLPASLAFAERRLGWSAHWLAHPLRLVPGLALFVLGGLLATRAAREMVRAGRGTPLPATCAAELVTSGPYASIRNPMAAGSLAQGVGVALSIGSPVVLLYALTGIVAWELLVRHEEEDWLQTTFGAAYADYRARVRCWWPHLRVFG